MRVFLAIIFLLFNKSAYSESLKFGNFEDIKYLYDTGEILVCEELSFRHFKNLSEVYDARDSSKIRVVFIINDDSIVETGEKSDLYYLYHRGDYADFISMQLNDMNLLPGDDDDFFEKSENFDPIKKLYWLQFSYDHYYRIIYNKVSNSIYMEKNLLNNEIKEIHYSC